LDHRGLFIDLSLPGFFDWALVGTTEMASRVLCKYISDLFELFLDLTYLLDLIR
jgi:hypothetical protein